MLIDHEVKARAEASREEHRRSQAIAELASKARSAGARMDKIASFVKRVRFDGPEDVAGELRPVTRQAVDLMLAARDGRASEHREETINGRAGVNPSAFG